MAAMTTMPELADAGLDVPLATGGTRRYVNLDYAASSPAMRCVVAAVGAALPWYSSVHRGAGFPSRVATGLYEAARERIGSFVGAGPEHAVIIVRNTTDGVNLLAHCLPIGKRRTVLSTAVEHHANMLPWRRVAHVVHLAPPPSREALIAGIDAALRAHDVALVAVTGASNVTGEIFPLREITELVHRHGALVSVDAAQLAPHRPIDVLANDVDCLTFSGHKMYAPFGAGAVVVRRSLVAESEPFLAGGGAVDYVGLDDVAWTAAPERFEAGSPNVIGTIALAAACIGLDAAGMRAVAHHERTLLTRLEGRLARIDRLTTYRLWSDGDRVGLCTFRIEGMSHALVAAVLSAEHAIGVRHGCFCAHPYIAHLLGMSAAESRSLSVRLRSGARTGIPGAVRASFGIGTTEDDVDRLADALAQIIVDGPALEYVEDASTGDYEPVNGVARPLPVIPGLPGPDAMGHPGGCGRS